MSALFVTGVNAITNCLLAFADAVNCWMLAMFSPPVVAKRAGFPAPSHLVREGGFIARATEKSEAALPGYNIPSSSFAGGCSGRDHSVRTFLNLPRNYLNDCYELTITIYLVIGSSYHSCNKVVWLN
jgi:hypothetical protein